jgi:hypothetical protein
MAICDSRLTIYEQADLPLALGYWQLRIGYPQSAA